LDFIDFIASGALALMEGAVIERVRREGGPALDPQVLNGGLIYDPEGRATLGEIHQSYIRAAEAAGLPIVIFTDTWRCSANSIAASQFQGRPVNQDNARFLLELRTELANTTPVFVGGLLGPSGDAYKPNDSLSRQSAREFHRPQIEALARSGVDFLHLATAPNVEEALGTADALAETDLPYMISFVIRRSGAVLDGTLLGAAIERIDAETIRQPIGFSVNCVHPGVLDSALTVMVATHPSAVTRLLAFQANTADLEPEELDGRDELITTSPVEFATSLRHLRERFGLRFLGGCCGTDPRHVQALASRIAPDSFELQ